MLFFVAFWLFIIFLGLEVFVVPGTVMFVSLALGFLAVAVVSLFVKVLLLLFLVWIASALCAVYFINSFLKHSKLSRSENSYGETNIVGMVGGHCLIIKSYNDDQYLVRYGFEEWSAVSRDLEKFEIGEKVLIIRVVGNRLVIKKLNEVKEEL